jgi:hypothetical protein
VAGTAACYGPASTWFYEGESRSYERRITSPRAVTSKILPVDLIDRKKPKISANLSFWSSAFPIFAAQRFVPPFALIPNRH